MKNFRFGRIIFCGFLALAGYFAFPPHFVSADPPVISNINSTAASGSAFITWSTDNPTDSSVSFGLTTAYGQTASDIGEMTEHSVVLSGLEENTLYHYQISSTDASGTNAVSGDLTFTTATTDAGPVISDIAMATSTGFILISWDTDKVSSTGVEYGLTTAYGDSVGISELVTAHTAYLQSAYFHLNTSYHYRVKSVDPSGNISYSPDQTFIFTNSLSIPRAFSVQVISIASSTAVISWSTDKADKTELDYGPFGGAYGSVYSDNALTTDHRAIVTGLQNDTKYGFDIILVNDGGGKRISTDPSYYFTTATDAAAPVISGANMTSRATTAAAFTWATNEAADSRIDYGPDNSYGSSTSDSTLTLSHSFTFSNLRPFTNYHYRLQSVDTSGNVATTTDAMFTTGIDTANMPLNQRVLILVNDATPAEAGTGGIGASKYTGQYYATARGIPNSNILHLNITGGIYSTTTYNSLIQTPVKNFLDANNGKMKSQIIYIVPVYGMPVAIPGPFGTAALDSMLSYMYWNSDQFSTYDNVDFVKNYPSMPTSYGTTRTTGQREPKFNYWSDARDLAGQPKVFAVARIDGPTAMIAKRLVDDAISAESTLTRNTGTSYFDIEDRAEPAPNYLGYSYIDRTVKNAAYLTAAAGFPTVFNHQSQTGHMIPPDAFNYFEDGTVNSYLYQPNSPGIYVQSIRGQDATASFNISTISKGEIDIGLKGMYFPDGSPNAKVILNTANPSQKIEVNFPEMGNYDTYSGSIKKYFSDSNIGALYKMTGSSSSSSADAILKITFDPNIIAVSYFSSATGTTSLATLQNASATPFDISNISLDFHGWAGMVKGIKVLDGSGNVVYADPMTSDTTANYSWQLSPMGGPNTLWAYGWYSGNWSYDAYRFVPGSVAAQMTSYTGCLKNPGGNSRSTKLIQRWWGCWVGRMLEEGVTATFGTVAEPYTNGYTMGDVFYDHFFAGYNFGDSYLVATPSVDWTMVAVGDPLYAPQIFASGASDTTPPAAPTGVVVTSVSTSTVALAWNPATDNNNVTGYLIYRNGVQAGGSSTTSFTDIGLSAGTSYAYNIASVDAGRNISVWSATTTAKTTSFSWASISPSSVRATTTGSSAAITWLTSSSTSFTLNYGTSTTYSAYLNNPAFTTSHSVTLNGILPNTTYHYQISDRNLLGIVFSSNDYTFTTGDFPLITGIAAATAGNNYVVSWTTDRAADSRVDYGATVSLDSSAASSTLDTFHSLMIPNTAEYFKITSTDAGGKTASSLTYYIIPSSSPVNFVLSGLEGRTAGDLQKAAFRFEIFDPASGNVLSDVNVGSSAMGNILVAVPAGLQMIDIRIVMPGYLPETVSNIDLSTSTPITLPALSAGDVNNDGIVNSLDTSFLNQNWNKNYAIGDYNHDGIVNQSDLNYAINNWFKIGN
jgi:uncharacterized protein (TIGR03790 family)